MKCSVRDALEKHPEIRFDGFNLSDIFEYMDIDLYTEELESILEHAEPDCRLVYWNMLADRSRPETFSDRIQPLSDIAEELFNQDKAFFYKAFIVEKVI